MEKLIKNLAFSIKSNNPVIDNFVFKLHYKYTFIILLSFCSVISFKQFFSDPIKCFTRYNLDENLVNNFCWMNDLFEIKKNFHIFDLKSLYNEKILKSKSIFYNHYKTYGFILFFQALLFYLPRFFWKSLEQKRVKKLTSLFNSSLIKKDEKNKEKIVYQLIIIKNKQYFYFWFFFITELLNLINLSYQIYFIVFELSESFEGSIFDYLKFYKNFQDSNTNYHLFPPFVKCLFEFYNSSQFIIVYEALCVLTLQSLIEKFQLFLFFWFIFLFICTTSTIIYRLLLIFSKKFRVLVIQFQCYSVNVFKLRKIVYNSSINYWFLIYLLSKNLDFISFDNLIDDLFEEEFENI